MKLIKEKFEAISPIKIIKIANLKTSNNYNYINKKPVELLKTEYIAGQTIILKGMKDYYIDLIEFWLSTQVWYGSEGECYLYKNLVIDNLKIYSEWQDSPKRVGICLIADDTKKQYYNKRISDLLKTEINQDYLIMNPTWNEEKVLFSDENNYYLYHFWSGE